MGTTIQRSFCKKLEENCYDRQHYGGSCSFDNLARGSIALEPEISANHETRQGCKTEYVDSDLRVEEAICLDVDMLIYVIGAFLMAGISLGFVVWGFKTGQFVKSANLKRKMLEEDEAENDS
jgi:nitrogen fixation-related uncharacterized protein